MPHTLFYCTLSHLVIAGLQNSFWQNYLQFYMHPLHHPPNLKSVCIHWYNKLVVNAKVRVLSSQVTSYYFTSHSYSLCFELVNVPTIINTSWADVVEQSVVAVSTKQRAWKHNSVKRNVVFGHELIELHFLRVLPPLLPLISVAGSDRQIATDCRYRNVPHACIYKIFYSYQQHCRS